MNIRMSVMSLLLLSLLAVAMETVWCQDEVFSRQQLTQALRKLTERVTELEDKEKQAGEVGKLVEQLGEKMTEGIEKLGVTLGDKIAEGIQKLGEQITGAVEKTGEKEDARANKLAQNLEKINEGMDKMGGGIETIAEVLAGQNNSCPVLQPTQKPTSCVDVREYDRSNSVHTLTVNGVNIKVFCDQQTAGGGWIVLQRRQDGSVDFNRNWTDYENGFGDLNGEFWLGLSNMHRLTSSKNYSLRVKLTDRNNIKAYALYDTFYIDGPDQYYTLHVAGYSGTAGDGLIVQARGQEHYYLNNQPFSTPDRDHDQYSTFNCAAYHQSGWWHNHCFRSNLNVQYGSNGNIVWYSGQKSKLYKYVSMMMKPRSDV